MSDGDTPVGRAMRRAGYHLLRAAIETVKAVEVVLEELAAESDRDGNEPPKRQRIEVE